MTPHEPAAEPGGQPRPPRRPIRWLLRQLEHCLALFGLVMIVYFVAFDFSSITSESMKPTLLGTSMENGDLVLTEKVSYRFREPRRWEVATIRRKKDGMEVMKRIVGLPGERLQIFPDGEVIINGEQVKPPAELEFIKYLPVANIHERKVFDCQDGYYVLGDYVLDSDDSRFNGTVPRDEIIGRSWIILAPSARRGFVNP